jgi:hypothetical protein
LDGNLGISGAIDDPYGVPNGLYTVRHEAFEVGFGDSIPIHDVVEVMLEKHLSILVFGLEAATSDHYKEMGV